MITSFRHDKQAARKRRLITALFLSVLVLGYIFRAPLLSTSGGVLHTLFRPVWSAGDAIKEEARAISALLASKVRLSEENRELRQQLEEMVIQTFAYEEYKTENTILKNALGRAGERTFLLAAIIGAPGLSPFDTLVLDVGSTSGITEGMSVFADEHILLGEVTRVFRSSAVVTLYSSPGIELPVRVGEEEAPAVALGVGGGSFRAQLPAVLKIAPGDPVRIPNLSPTYVGTVSGVQHNEGSSLQIVFFSLPINIYQLKRVYIDTYEGG